MNFWEAIILAIIEGLTEFLPVSSTGHMIIASSFMGIAHEEFTKLFTIAIQLGTILSVVVLYVKRFFQSIDFSSSCWSLLSLQSCWVCSLTILLMNYSKAQ